MSKLKKKINHGSLLYPLLLTGILKGKDLNLYGNSNKHERYFNPKLLGSLSKEQELEDLVCKRLHS